MHCQAPLHMVGELCDKGGQKLFHLLLGWMQRIFNAGKQCSKDKQNRLLERLVLHFVCHCVKQSPKGTDIFVFPLRQEQHQVTREHKCHMCCQCVVRETVALLPEAQDALAGFEEHLDVPAFPVNGDDVLRTLFHVRAENGNPFLLVCTMPDADNAGRYPLFAGDVHVNREKIFRTPSAFPLPTENLLGSHELSLEQVLRLAALLDGGDDVKLCPAAAAQ